MSPQTKNGLDSPSAFQTYTELSRDKPFSFIPEGSCPKHRGSRAAALCSQSRSGLPGPAHSAALQNRKPGLVYLQSPLWPEPGLGHPRLFH